VVDISASGNFGSGAMAKARPGCGGSQRAGLLRNPQTADKVGLIFVHGTVSNGTCRQKKGRRHVLRVVRDILYHEPRGVGTDTVKTLDVVNRVLHRRAVVFLISDFETSGDRAQPARNYAGGPPDLIVVTT